MNIQTAYDHLGYIATDTETGKQARSSFDEGKQVAIDRLRAQVGKTNRKVQDISTEVVDQEG